ncbi:hypothetical protein Leryth_016825 [Lithospermum erythrorhizon]|nr:hypothetical protein Leryth_016825 [Lithospermum erythrorhizon]
MFNYFLLSLILVFALPQDVTKAQNDQPGFISIDCGLQGPNYTDTDISDMYYTSDTGFVDSGVSRSVSSVYVSDSDISQQLKTLRYFPEGSRNCYTLRPVQGKEGRYLIRGRFMYGNYDGLNQPPTFDLYIGLQYWETVTITTDTLVARREIIHSPSSDYINVCLVKTSPGIPFITTLELRPLPADMYETKVPVPRGSLNLFFRFNMNASEDYYLRFNDDTYDRFWTASNLTDTIQLSTERPIVSNTFAPPQLVMSTALTPTNTSDGRLRISWVTNITDKFFLYLHFAELELLAPNQSRTFDIIINGLPWYRGFTPTYLSTNTIFDTEPLPSNTTNEVELVKTANSTLLPLLNAIELYTLIEFPLQQTQDGDVAAMLSIKITYNLSQNWQGDPCGPEGFRWIGVNCSANDDSNAPRITSLNLSSKKLVGSIAPAIFELKALRTLDLSNNNLGGTVPEFLAELQSLTVLKLKGNNFSQPFPQQLLNKANSGTLTFEYDNSSDDVCQSESCNNNKKKKKSIVVPIAAAVGGVLFIICASLLAFFIIRSRKPKAKMVDMADQERRFINDPNSTPMSQMSNASPVITKLSSSSENTELNVITSKSRQFSYHEVLQITNNFQRVIGKGGFGTVYHGYVDDIQVAVKMLSPSSTQGYKEFQAEATLLLTIHHRNLTSLVGYCYEGSNMGILYEYMANGNLEKHLLGKGSGSYVLTWEERLRMATDAAQGTLYV